MSDEEMDDDGAAGPSRGQQQGRARSSNSFNAITPAQLAQVWSLVLPGGSSHVDSLKALSAAAGASGRGAPQGFQGFQGVTGLGPAASRFQTVLPASS